MYKLYSMQRSGNSYKVRLALALLNAPYRAIEIDILRGESRTPDFLAKNPSGQVPLLEVAEGRYLAEFNAILWYVAGGTPLAPDTRIERAETLQWMFFEQYSHEPYIAVSRFIRKYLPPDHPRRVHLDALKASGEEALAAMERHLCRLPWFGGEHYTIADIALFAYTHVAEDGGFDLGGYPHVERWIKRVMQQPGFVPMRDADRAED